MSEKMKQNENQGKYPAFWIYNIVTLAIYGLALLTCFICNLAISHHLSWFYIVLTSVLLSCSITNLPYFFKKHRLFVSGAAVTVMVYVLLYACCVFANGNWLFSFAYPIATYSLVFAWLILVIVRYLHINWGYKTGVILLLAAIFNITCNPLIAYFLGDEYKLMDTFIYDGGTRNYSANEITFVCLLAVTVISIIAGVVMSLKSKSEK